MNHFKLSTNSKVNVFGVKLFQIELTIDCQWGSKGDLGGWIEKESNLQENAWVYGNAQLYGNAWVYGNAQVYGNAWVYGNAQVYGDAWVYGNAQVYGDAWEQTPLQIQGTKHFITECKKGYLQIGCMSFTFEYWKNNFESIGKSAKYTEKQIKEYGLYIELAINLSKI